MRATKCLGFAVVALAASVLVGKRLFTALPEEDVEADDVSMLQTQVSDASVAKKKLPMPLTDLMSATGDLSLKKSFAEFIAMTLFVSISCGSAMSIAKAEGSAWVLQVALTFGFCITALAYTVGYYSGGQINCAVTFGLLLLGKVTVAQAICNFIAQMLGSIFGALILNFVYAEEKDCTGGLATNKVQEGFSQTRALVAEVLGTFLLMYVVLETAVDPGTSSNRALACLAIGLAVFLAHSMLIPIDGCSINPTRSFGTAVAASMSGPTNSPYDNFWVFVFGPLLGATLAVGVFHALRKCGPPESSAWMTDDKEAIQQELDEEEE